MMITISIASFTIALAATLAAYWPREGSYLADTAARRRMLIRATREQDHRLGAL